MREIFKSDDELGNWLIPAVNELMKKSEKLSENIFNTEQEIQNLNVFLQQKV